MVSNEGITLAYEREHADNWIKYVTESLLNNRPLDNKFESLAFTAMCTGDIEVVEFSEMKQ